MSRHRWRLHGPYDTRPTRVDLAVAKDAVPDALRSTAWAVCLRCGAQRIAVYYLGTRNYRGTRKDRTVAVDVRDGAVVKACAGRAPW